jgi:hypothetical protein
MPNACETKTCYSPEELHYLKGCHRICNYQHIISASKDSTLLNSGEFPLTLGFYATIPKAPCGKPIDRLPLKYLDIVHVDIAFGDCISIRASNMHLILWTLLHVSIGHLVSNCYNTTISCLHFSSFETKLGHSQDKFVVIAMKSFLAVPSDLSFT